MAAPLLHFLWAPSPRRASLSPGMNNRAHLSLDDPFFDATFAPSRSRQGAFARHCDGRTGCGVPRVAVCKATPGGSGNPPSATTSGREELADGEAFLASSRAGPGQQPPRWSAERRTSRVMGREAPRKRLRAYVIGPPTGAAAPERLSALRSPRVCARGNSKPRRSS